MHFFNFIFRSIVFLSFFGQVGLAMARNDAGDAGPKAPDFSLAYLKNGDGSVSLTAFLGISGTLLTDPVKGVEIQFFSAVGDEPLLLGSAFTEKNGNAVLRLPNSRVLPKNEDHFMVFLARFNGTPELEAAEASAEARDLKILLTAEIVDSVKTLSAQVWEYGPIGEEIPVNELDIVFYAQRMFSLLPLGTGTLEEGMATATCPDDLPGDSIGNLIVLARLADDENFANVECRLVTSWGVPTRHQLPTSYRALWTQIAPTWMIITLTIMLLGVWGHYFYAIYKLICVRREGKKGIILED